MKKLFFSLLIAATALVSCDNVDESERLIYVKPAAVGRAVLIEDFTGQRCVNCPAATAEIEKLQEQYGADTVIAVGIHSGPLGFKGNAKTLGLATDTGDEYYNYWNIEYQPQGVVNRNSGRLDYTAWGAAVYNAIQQEATLDLDLSTTYDAASRNATISLSALGTNGPTTGKLQLWVVEDSITALQVRYNDIFDSSTGQINDASYVHNHVFREAINGTWGEDFSLAEGETKQLQFAYQLPEGYAAKYVSIIAFVYNDNGVQQVTKRHLVSE